MPDLLSSTISLILQVLHLQPDLAAPWTILNTNVLPFVQQWFECMQFWSIIFEPFRISGLIGEQIQGKMNYCWMPLEIVFLNL